MSTKTHKKLCWSCDGYVHVYEMQCPYCGANLVEREKAEAEESAPLASSQSLAQEPKEALAPPYQGYNYGYTEPSPNESREESQEESQPEPVREDLESPLATLLLLIPGSVFFILGCALWWFSSDGVLTFTFKAKYWPLFLVGALPLLYFGYRSLFSTAKPAQHELSPFDLQSG